MGRFTGLAIFDRLRYEFTKFIKSRDDCAMVSKPALVSRVSSCARLSLRAAIGADKFRPRFCLVFLTVLFKDGFLTVEGFVETVGLLKTEIHLAIFHRIHQKIYLGGSLSEGDKSSYTRSNY